MKNIIFRIAVLLASILPGMLVFGMTWISMWEGSFMFFIFASSLVIYAEYIFNTILFFKKETK